MNNDRTQRAHFRRLLQNKTVRDGSIVFGSTVLVNGCNYMYHMICSRMLGVTAYGTLATLIAGYSMAIALATVLNLTTAKFAAELSAVNDLSRLRSLAVRMTKICAALFLSLILAFLAVAPVLSPYVHIDFWALAIATLSVGLAIIVPATRGILQGVQNYIGLSYATGIESVIRFVVGVGLSVLGFGPTGAMAGFALGSLVSIAFATNAVQSHFGVAHHAQTLHIDGRRLAKTTIGVAVSTLALTVLGFVDVILVKHFLSADDAGLYGVLSLTGKIIMFSVSFIPTILLPKAVEAFAKGLSPGKILWKAFILTFVLSALSLAMYFCFPTLLIRVMAGVAYVNVAPYVFPYGLATAVLALTTLVSTYKIGMHDFSFAPRQAIIAAAEICAIYQHHESIAMIVKIVLFVNIAGLGVTLLPRFSISTAFRRAR